MARVTRSALALLMMVMLTGSALATSRHSYDSKHSKISKRNDRKDDDHKVKHYKGDDDEYKPTYEKVEHKAYNTPRYLTEKDDSYKTEQKYHKEEKYYKGSSYPVCNLPAPYSTDNLHTSFNKKGEFKACVELSGKKASNHVQAFDLFALQLVVSDKCYDAVKSVSFDGEQYNPKLTKYTNEHNVGVKISSSKYHPLATYADLYKKSVKVCIVLKFPCANADSLFNIVTYFAKDAKYCATTSLFNNNNKYTKEYKGDKYDDSPKYEASPKYDDSPKYEASPKYEQSSKYTQIDEKY